MKSFKEFITEATITSQWEKSAEADSDALYVTAGNSQVIMFKMGNKIHVENDDYSKHKEVVNKDKDITDAIKSVGKLSDEDAAKILAMFRKKVK